MSNLNRNDPKTWLRTVWEPLEESREHNEDMTDDEWDDICTAMAWLAEAVGVDPADPDL